MKDLISPCLMVFLSAINCSLIAQEMNPRHRPMDHDPPEGMMQPGHGRLEKCRKVRLVEVLKLNEDDAARFFAKETSHEEIVRDLMKSRNAALNQIEDGLRDKGSDHKDIEKLSDQIRDIDQ